ncbi:MAG: hypothetical protein HKN01_06255 [Acidimicrobiia bacterium]|nr:hypothetical protein [Acidimicrobiia bacterium]
MTGGAVPGTDGVQRFARFAFPPNQLGYCGPDDARAVLEYTAAGVTDPGLVEIAQAFEGAWPYLELIAHSNGIPDPLDDRVVSAYWLGNDLLAAVPAPVLARHIADRFGERTTLDGREAFDAAVATLPAPHHNFHVLSVYPWVGLLRSGMPEEPLRILDQCRIRWGTVMAVDGATVVVETPRLVWDGNRLDLGPALPEVARVAEDGYRLAPTLGSGDIVALHWDWVCDVIDGTVARQLQRLTAAQLDATNRSLLAA